MPHVRTTSILLALFLVAGPARGQAGQGIDEDRAAVLAASRAFSAAYVEGDTATIRSLYTADAVLLPPGRMLTGNAAIARYFAPGAERVHLHHVMDSARLEIDGGLAVDMGTWHDTWMTDAEEERNASGPYLVVWRRDAEGRWRIAYDMWQQPSR